MIQTDARDAEIEALSGDIRWAINVLLEKIATKFEANDTWDIWKSDAASLVRSFKHDLSALPAQFGSGVQCREDVARIIDPIAFDVRNTWMELRSHQEDREKAFAKADLILAPKPAGQPVEGRAKDLNAMALLKRLRRPDSYCADECEGRCIECPDNLIRDAAAYIEHMLSPAPASPQPREGEK